MSRQSLSRTASMGRSGPYSYTPPNGSIQRYSSHHGTSSAFSASANPNEDWTKVSDLAERRRIQNRIAQRNYRKKLKKRLEDLEKRAGSSASPEPRPDTISPPISTPDERLPRNDKRVCVSAPPGSGRASPSSSVDQPNAYFLRDDRLQFSHPHQRSPSPPPPVPQSSQAGSFEPINYYQPPSHSPMYQSYDNGYDVSWFDRSSVYSDSLSSGPPSAARFTDPRRGTPVKSELYGEDFNPFNPLGVNNYAPLNSLDLAAQQQQNGWQYDTDHNNPHTPPLSDTNESSCRESGYFTDFEAAISPDKELFEGMSPPTPAATDDFSQFFFL